MHSLIHMISHDPLLFGLAAFGILLVVGLKLNDWSEKRRERQMTAIRQWLKEQNQSGTPSLAGGKGTALPGNWPLSRPPFRIFRWEFVLLAIVAGAVAIPMKMRVSARHAKPKVTQTPPTRAKSPAAPAEKGVLAKTNSPSRYAESKVRVRAVDLNSGGHVLAFPVGGGSSLGGQAGGNSY